MSDGPQPIDWSSIEKSSQPPAADPAPSAPRAITDGPPPAGRSGWDARRAAAVAFAAYLAVAFVLLITRLGRTQWFFLDEWDFLADRTAGNLDDLFRPHNEHWSTLPIIVYRALYSVFGLHSYRPYQIAIVATHLAVAVLLRAVMRRAGVSPWVASVTASLIVLFGPGYQNIVWGFQIGFVGALAFGLAQLLLIDHDDPVDRRDLFGLGCGALALLCSGVGVTMVAIVGLATILRRGWRPAAVQVVPLAALYGVWWAFERPPNFQNPDGSGAGHIGRVVVSFVVEGVRTTFGSLGYLWPIGIVIAVVMVVGLVLAWSALSWSAWRSRRRCPSPCWPVRRCSWSRAGRAAGSSARTSPGRAATRTWSPRSCSPQ